MTRNELIQILALDVIADDYESFDKTVADVSTLGRNCGITIGAWEIAEALRILIKSDLARAYRLSPSHTFEPIRGLPAADGMEERYFWVTEKGRELQLADFPGWPFDEKGLLRADWSPPV